MGEVVWWWSEVAALDALVDEVSDIVECRLDGGDTDSGEVDAVTVFVVVVGDVVDDVVDVDVDGATDDPKRTSKPRRTLLSI